MPQRHLDFARAFSPARHAGRECRSRGPSSRSELVPGTARVVTAAAQAFSSTARTLRPSRRDRAAKPGERVTALLLRAEHSPPATDNGDSLDATWV